MKSSSSEYSDDEEITEFQIEPEDLLDQEEAGIENKAAKKRGRKAVPEQWTRVISLNHDDLSQIKLQIISTDLLIAPNLPKLSRQKREKI